MKDTPADLLRKARIRLGFRSATAAAVHFGFNTSTYRSSENGTRPISKRLAAKYSKAFNIPATALLNIDGAIGNDGETEEIISGGEVAMGVWRESSLKPDKVQRVSIPRSRRKLYGRKAVEVKDESVNLAVGPGEMAIYIEWDEADVPSAGMLLYIERMKGDLLERSIRRVEQVSEHKYKLAPFSSVSRYAETVQFPARNGEAIRIIGREVGKYVEFE